MNVSCSILLGGLVCALSAVSRGEEGLLLNLDLEAARFQGNQAFDLVNGVPATVDGPMKFGGTAATPALLLNKSDNHVSLPYEPNAAYLPREAMTIETWVCVEQTVEWGGIIGPMEDRGGAQKGFMLGFRQSNFSFGISTEGADDGDGRMTHIRDRHSLEWGRWYHVAGTYDGKDMCLYVNGRLAAGSKTQSGPILYPARADFLIGSLTQGDTRFFWRGWLRTARLYDHALTADQVAAHYAAEKDAYPRDLRVGLGPVAERVSRESIRIQWETAYPSPSSVFFGSEPTELREVSGLGPGIQHEVQIDDVAPGGLYFYRLLFNDAEGAAQWTRLHEFDATYAFSMIDIAPGKYPYASEEDRVFWGRAAERILEQTGIRKGYALVIGSGEGRLAYELAARSELKVVGVDDDPGRIQRARVALDTTGLYGVRVKIQEGDPHKLPYGQYFANLVVSELMLADSMPPSDRNELLRVTRPNGGTIFLGCRASLLAQDSLKASLATRWLESAEPFKLTRTDEGEITWFTYVTPPLEGAREWTHMYATPANTACSEDPYPGLNMRPLWFGEPGPRPMTDRGLRGPAPLCADGRLFVQGDCRLFGMDAYNGTILWERDVPDLRRANVPRCSSNMAADGGQLFTAIHERCWVWDGQTGVIRATYDLPSPADSAPHDWGYIAVSDGLLFGTAVKQGALYVGADGEWYDARGEESEKTISDVLFALDKDTAAPRWTYTGAAVVDSTIAIGGGRVYFIECRNPEVSSLDVGRVGMELNKDRFLVALDVTSGNKMWEVPFEGRPALFVHYLMYADEKLVSLSSSGRWDMYTFAATDGSPLWEHQAPLIRDNHGGGMQHPAIIGKRIYAEPCLLDLDTGQVFKDDIKGRSGCGTVSASANAVIFRDGTHAIWDLKEDKRARWGDLRPGCWLGMIPAGGLILAPESGAGCWCAGVPMETSIAFARPVE